MLALVASIRRRKISGAHLFYLSIQVLRHVTWGDSVVADAMPWSFPVSRTLNKMKSSSVQTTYSHYYTNSKKEIKMSPQVHGATVLPLRVCPKLQNIILQLPYKPSGKASPIQSLLTYFTWHSNILVYLLTPNFELLWTRPSLHTVCQHLDSLPQDTKRDLTL